MISLGKDIYSILSNSSAVTNLIGDKIFPLITPEKISLPCVVYERQGSDEFTKDGHSTYTTQVILTVIATDYSTSIDIAEACNAALDEYSGGSILKIRFQNANEAYAEDVFMQRLQYEVKSR